MHDVKSLLNILVQLKKKTIFVIFYSDLYNSKHSNVNTDYLCKPVWIFKTCYITQFNTFYYTGLWNDGVCSLSKNLI